MYEKQDEIIDAFMKRAKPFIDYKTKDKKIKFTLEKMTGNPENRNYNDTLWKEAYLPFNWDTRKDAWFRKKIIVPEEINRVSTSGSEMKISGESIWACPVLNMHAELYIDGKEVFVAQNYMDFSFLQVLSEKVSPYEEHTIAIHTYGKEGVVAFYSALPVIEVHYSNIDNIAFELESFIEELKFAQSLSDGKEIIEKAIKKVKAEDIETIDLQDLLNLINNIRNNLSILKPLAKQYVIHLIGHAHIDMNWLWPVEETVDVCENTFNTVINLMDEFPNFCFSQSQAYVYKEMEEKYPELFKKIKKRISQGRWDVTASTWVELDLNMASGESIVRQILYAKKYIMEKFNFDPRVCWSPDTFGHPWTIPQILKKSGINYCYFMRASKKDYELFWWEGPDGSKVLTYNGSYLGNINPNILVKLAKYTKRSQDTNISMYIYGIGDHGGGPTAEDIDMVNKLNKKPVFPRLEFSTTHKYFDAISKQKINIPVINDEFNPIFDGCYTTHWDTKVHNRKCERLILEAETIGMISRLLGGKYSGLREPWEITLFNQFHDILPGSAIKSSYEYSNKQAEEAEKIAGEEIYDSFLFISSKVKVKEEGLPIIVFNNLSWNRTDVVSIELNKNINKYLVIKDKDGNVFPAQIVDGKLIFTARNVPSLGYKIFYICEDESIDTQILTENLTLENKFFILEIDKKTGTVSFLYDKKNDKLVMKNFRSEGAFPENTFPLKLENLESNIPSTVPSMNNLLQVLYEDFHLNSAWVIGPISNIVNLIESPEVEILSTGPVVGRVRIKNKFNKSTIIQDISVYNEVDRIDFKTYINWQEKSGPNTKAPMLKASFTPILNRTKAFFEIPFGYIERIADGREFPALNWVDISDDKYGVSLLSNTKYGFDVSGNTMRITLVRTSYEPDPDPDRGEHEFTYSIYPHEGDFKKANTVRKGYELNHPLMACYINKGGNLLPQVKSFVKINVSNVVLTCFKKAEDNEDLIIRVYECKGEENKATINFGFNISNAEEVDLIERPVSSSNILLDKNEFTFTVKPYEIKSFRIETGG